MCAEFSTTLAGGEVQDVSMGGTLCIGAEEDCEDGEPSDQNLIAAVTVSYEAATAPSLTYATNGTDPETMMVANTANSSWLFTAEVTHLGFLAVLAPLGVPAITSVSLDGIAFNFSSVSIGDVNFG